MDTTALQTGMNNRLAQLQGAYVIAGQQAQGLVSQALLSQTDVDQTLMQTGTTIEMLGAELYQAVLGNHPFPLDGSTVDQPAAAQSWDQLAQDVQDALTNVLRYEGGYGTAWSAVKTLAQMGLDAALPVLKPVAEGLFWVGVVALGIFFGPELLGTARAVKSLSGVKKKRRKGWW